MAGDWIKMRTNLDTDPAVVRIASALQTDRYAVVGRLHRIWSWANEHLVDGRDVPVDSAFLDALVESPGFAEQLRRVGWLSGRDGSLKFPAFERHNGESAKKRAQDADRKQRSRKKQASRTASEKCPPDNRTESGPEKRREEKSNNTLSARERSKHWQSEEFREVWRLWCRHMAAKFNPLTEMAEESQFYELDRHETDWVVGAIRFSLQKNTKSLILNGEHEVQDAKPTAGRRKGLQTTEEMLPT